MVNRKKILLTVLFLLICSLFDAASQSKLKQKIEWKEDPNAFEYKVELKNLADGTTDTFTTEKSSVTFSKPAGKYQYRITAYDFLGRESSVSRWQPIEFVKALKPKVEKVKEKVEVKPKLTEEGKAVADTKIEIPVDIESVTKDSKVELVNPSTNEKIPAQIVFDRASDEKEKKAQKILVSDVKGGDWKIRVTNPGGFTAESEQLVKIEKITDEELARFEEEKRLEKERIAKEKEEAERLAREEAERLEAERLAKEEAERLAKEKRLEAERLAKEEAERQRLEAERLAEEEAERLAREEAELLEREEKARLEAAKIAKEIAERDAAERQAKLEEEERARKEAERLEAERLAKEEADRLEAERLAREEEERAEKLRRARQKKLAAKKKAAKPAKDIILTGAFGIALDTQDTVLSELHSSSTVFSPHGCLMYLPLKSKDYGWRFGSQLNASYMTFTKSYDYAEVDTSALAASFDFVLQRRLFADQAMLELKAGGGLMVFETSVTYKNLDKDNPSDKFYTQPLAMAGLGLMVIPVKHLVFEFGADYNYCKVSGENLFLLRTYLGMGLRF
jgi:hypothetical protein